MGNENLERSKTLEKIMARLNRLRNGDMFTKNVFDKLDKDLVIHAVNVSSPLPPRAMSTPVLSLTEVIVPEAAAKPTSTQPESPKSPVNRARRAYGAGGQRRRRCTDFPTWHTRAPKKKLPRRKTSATSSKSKKTKPVKRRLTSIRRTDGKPGYR